MQAGINARRNVCQQQRNHPKHVPVLNAGMIADWG